MWKTIIGGVLIVNMLVCWIMFGLCLVTLGQSLWGIIGIFLFVRGFNQLKNKKKGVTNEKTQGTS